MPSAVPYNSMLYSIHHVLQECKEFLFKEITEHFLTKSYIQLTKAYIVINKIYDMCIKILEEHADNIELEKTHEEKEKNREKFEEELVSGNNPLVNSIGTTEKPGVST
jgi:hypothetical protein